MPLPKSINPIKSAKQHTHFQGELDLNTCSRLQEMCEQGDKQATIELTFGQDENHVYFIKGHLSGTIQLICQRCNEPMDYAMDISFLLSPVTNEERAKKLSDRYDPVFMNDEMISVIEMIEDEILLALPMVPKHRVCAETHNVH